MNTTIPEYEPVAAVCDNQVRIYGAKDKKTGVRPLENVLSFKHRGAALAYAIDFDDTTARRYKQ